MPSLFPWSCLPEEGRVGARNNTVAFMEMYPVSQESLSLAHSCSLSLVLSLPCPYMCPFCL